MLYIMVYCMVYTTWYIPWYISYYISLLNDIFHGIYHGIYHMVYTIWYTPIAAWYIPSKSGIYQEATFQMLSGYVQGRAPESRWYTGTSHGGRRHWHLSPRGGSSGKILVYEHDIHAIMASRTGESRSAMETTMEGLGGSSFHMHLLGAMS
jgi:hypothetical protein